MVTEGNTTITLHNQSIEQIITTLRNESDRTGNPTPATVADTIEAQYHPDRERDEGGRPDAIGLCGLPGAGKGFVAEELSTVYDAPVVSMGDALRRQFIIQEVGENPDDPEVEESLISSDQLGEFAAKTRRKEAEKIPEWTIGEAPSDADLVIIDGVRSIVDYQVLDEHFDTFKLILVKASFGRRFDRIKERGREGEDEFEGKDLVERDWREKDDLGLGALTAESDPFRDGKHDLTFSNQHMSKEPARRGVQDMASTLLPWDVVETNDLK